MRGPVPRKKWKYRFLSDFPFWWERDTTSPMWGVCFSCGRVETWTAGKCWRCPDCHIDMPWAQVLPPFPWCRVPTSEEIIAYVKAKLKDLKLQKKRRKK